MRYAYIVIDSKKLRNIGYADTMAEIRQHFRNLAGYGEKFEGYGCYGYTFTAGKYQFIAWRESQNGFIDIDNVMAKAFEILNDNGMICHHS